MVWKQSPWAGWTYGGSSSVVSTIAYVGHDHVIGSRRRHERILDEIYKIFSEGNNLLADDYFIAG